MGQDVFPVNLVVEQIEPIGWFLLRFPVELPLKLPDLFRPFPDSRQSPILRLFGCLSEVRVLRSTGITRLRRYYDPLRGPSQPPSCRWRSVSTAGSGLRFCRRSPSPRAVLLTPVDCLGAFRCGVLRRSPRGLLPEITLAFPDPLSSRHPRFNFSRLAPASLPLRPAHLLTHLYRGLGRKASTPPVTRRRRFSATQAYRILLRWDFHPRVVCALSAHNG